MFCYSPQQAIQVFLASPSMRLHKKKEEKKESGADRTKEGTEEVCVCVCGEGWGGRGVGLVGSLTSQQHASVSQGRVCSDNFTCCHTEIEIADQTFHLTQSQYIDTRPTSPSADPIAPGAWQGSHWGAIFEVTGMTRSGQMPAGRGDRMRLCICVVALLLQKTCTSKGIKCTLSYAYLNDVD